MKKYLTNLNGWQRFFIFILLFIYLPLSIDRIAKIDLPNVQKYSDVEIKQKINDFIKKERIEKIISIEAFETDFDELAKKFGGKIEYKNDRDELLALRKMADISGKINGNISAKDPNLMKNQNLIWVSFSSENEYYYLAVINYSKKREIFESDADVKKFSAFTQGLINQTKLKIGSEAYMELLKILSYFTLAAFLTYFFGFMIGWVINGFKRNKGS
jgi:hypothetical protein